MKSNQASAPGSSRIVISSQTECHSNLEKVVLKHLQTRFAKPYAEHNVTSYKLAMDKVNRSQIIFDSGCGNGKSTYKLALKHPDAYIIGIDKSAARLEKNFAAKEPCGEDNFCIVRADLIDFLRLANADNIRLYKHYFIYPNPWPKKQHLHRRWQGSPVFRDIVELGGLFEVRSNWKTYTVEFAAALKLAGVASAVSPLAPQVDGYISDFEAKYAASEHPLWQLLSNK